LQWAGKWDDAIANYKKAIEIDPNLGRAYAGLAALAGNMGKRQEAVEYYKLAMARIDRMSDREKYRTRGGYFLTIRDADKAAEQYSALVQQYPADVAGTMNLANAHFYRRDMVKAREFGRRAVQISHNGLFQRNNVALYDLYSGDYDGAGKEAASILAENSTYVEAFGALAMAQIGSGKPDEAAQTYDKLKAVSARGASMHAMGMADLAIYRGRLREAISMLEQGANADLAKGEKELAGLKFATLAEAYWDSGKTAEALKAADRAITLNKTEHVLYRSGRLFALAKDKKRTGAVISELGEKMEPDPQSYAKLLEGESLLAQGDAKGALKSFAEAQKIADTWLGRFALGRGYLAASMFTEASSEFEQCLKRKGEASAVFLDDVPSLRLIPELYYRIGLAQQGLHSPAAADSFRTFLSIQSGGDAPMIAEAQSRLQVN
jgi:tetratricopeptide (TPR) repeat protein